MIAEVPLGAFLSGGVDSSAVVAMMAGLSDAPGATPARSASTTRSTTRASSPHGGRPLPAPTTASSTVDSDDFDLIDTLARLYDEPYADSSAIPTYRVSQLARKHVTVALSGDGGDESFGGYRRYRLHMMEERMRASVPAAIRQPLFGLLGKVYPKADWAPRMFRAKTTFEGMARTSVEAYFHSMSQLRQPLRSRFYSAQVQGPAGRLQRHRGVRAPCRRAQTDDPLSLIQYIDLHTYLVGDINTKVDRASMAHSLEVREPLMDHELVQWAASLPSSLKLQGSNGKMVLKKALEPHLPADVLYRPKMGFAVPLARWFRGPLRQRVRSRCSAARCSIPAGSMPA